MSHWSSKYLPEIAAELDAGRYTSQRGDNIRIGNNGSLSIKRNPDGTHVYFEFDGHKGGSSLDLIMAREGLDLSGAMRWARDWGLRNNIQEAIAENGSGVTEPGIVYGPSKAEGANKSGMGARGGARTFAAEWHYYNEDGEVRFRVKRFNYEGGGKDYIPQILVGNLWLYLSDAENAGHSVARVPYNLHLWHKAPKSETIYIAEGEKCADALTALGIHATSNMGGSNGWTPELDKYFEGRNVVILPDGDEAGGKWRDKVALALSHVAESVRIATFYEQSTDKSKVDVADWIAERGAVTKDELLSHIESIAQSAKDALKPTFLKNALDWFKEYRPPSYLIHGVWETGYLYTMTSPANHGKTAVALDIAFRVIRGIPLNGRKVLKGTVVYLAAENPDNVRGRAMAMAHRFGVSNEDMSNLWVLETPKSTAEFETLRRDIEIIGGARLVIMDTLQAFFDGNDSNDNTQNKVFMQNVRTFTRLTQFPTVVVLAHPVKNAHEDNLVPYGGGSVINEIDGNIGLWLDKDSGVATFKVHRKMRGVEFNPIQFKIEEFLSPATPDADGNPHPTVVALPISDNETTERLKDADKKRNELLRAMFANKGASFGELARIVGWTRERGDGLKEPDRRMVQSTIEKMAAFPDRSRVLVRKSHNGSYELTKYGEKFVANNCKEPEAPAKKADKEDMEF